MGDGEKYLRCRNCGRLIDQKEVFAQWYCSRDCALQFTSCLNCGKYFAKGKGSGDYCSPGCAQKYDDFRSK